MIDRLALYYAHENSNVHRGAHTLAARSTDAYEAARDKVRRFVNASSTKEIVFVRGATEGINLVAQSWGRRNVREGDEIVVTWSSTTPTSSPGRALRNNRREVEGRAGRRQRRRQARRIRKAARPAHPHRRADLGLQCARHGESGGGNDRHGPRHGALALVDGAQSVSHRRTDVQALDADFLVFSGHKMFAPTGIGVVYGKQAILDAMPPWQGGGDMIADVTFERTLYQAAPERFEAGTGNIADAVGLGAAIDYIERIGLTAIERHEHDLIECTVAGLADVPGVRLIGAPRERAGVVSFLLDGQRAEDVGEGAHAEGIAVRPAIIAPSRSCAASASRRGSRPSFALYNTLEDVEARHGAMRRTAASSASTSSSVL